MKTLMMGLSMVLLYGVLYSSALYACETCSSPNACAKESMMATKPTSCSLSATEYSDRMTEIELIFTRQQEVQELEDGYEFQFPGDDAELASRLTTFIVAERQCCSFFRFELIFASEHGPIWLSVRGSGDAKALVASLLETPITTNSQ